MLQENSSVASSAEAIDVAVNGDYNPGRRSHKKWLYIGVAGDLSFVLKDDLPTNVITMTLAVGYHPLDVQTIFAAGTTAEDILVLR